jgi:membrane protease YdiL (CAAX protease family)
VKKFVLLAIFCIAMLILFLATDPTKLPAAILPLPFAVLFMVIFAIAWTVLLHLERKKQVISRKRIVKFALLYAALPTVLLILQSIGQLTARDTLTLFVLFAVAYFYVARTSATPDRQEK